jgi:hypothetical protein
VVDAIHGELCCHDEDAIHYGDIRVEEIGKRLDYLGNGPCEAMKLSGEWKSLKLILYWPKGREWWRRRRGGA